MDERAYVAENARELERMRTLADGLSEQDLRLPVNEFWTVAAVYGHIAFWDARILALADKVDRGEPFAESDTEPEDVDWINDATRPLIHAVPPRSSSSCRYGSRRRPTLESPRCRRTECGRRTRTARFTACERRIAASISTTSKLRSARDENARLAPTRRAGQASAIGPRTRTPAITQVTTQVEARSPRADGVILQFLGGDTPWSGPPAFTGTLYFRPESVNALYEQIKEHTTPAWGPDVREWGTRELGVQDPEGTS